MRSPRQARQRLRGQETTASIIGRFDCSMVAGRTADLGLFVRHDTDGFGPDQIVRRATDIRKQQRAVERWARFDPT